MNARLLKVLDATVGRVLAGRLPVASQATLLGDVDSILVIRPGGIGDALLLAAMLRRLTERFPAARIELLAEGRNAAAFTMLPMVAAVRRYDRFRELFGLWGRRYDLIIDTEQWYCLPAVLARLLRAGRHIGFTGNNRERLRTDPVVYDSADWEREQFLRLLEPLGCDAATEGAGELLRLPDQARQRADSLLEPLGGGRIVALFPGASVPEKSWPAERFAAVVRALAVQGWQPVVVGGAAEAAAGERIVREAGGMTCAGMTTLAESLAVIARSSLFISGDSGLLHGAALLGVPTVALFGPSDPRKWAPRGPGSVVVCCRLPCSPCSRYGTIPPCSQGCRCMEEIGVREVLAAAECLLRPDGEGEQEREKVEGREE
ncbi:glycosyltransferase family 9 protein [Trichlorobacter ammonificans]|uniref:ADP-heptose--lipooligosaccharide heptosyltransferase II n=1 Tax=Trichlorobacter ammonificans TaxID=2916410 RepID=A0ABM9D8J2_9BACT|nr:glycosyltransferase family 9 protein [Trichlorobacter ammonificans]CAH2031030.1 ADP-heptose--lipooligosaccharide heptosyltransferase II [Trichlorobacter ammonificans]